MKYTNGRRTGLVTFWIETAFYNGFIEVKIQWGIEVIERQEKDVGSYWMTLRKGEDTLI
jgi:hypothetical protein